MEQVVAWVGDIDYAQRDRLSSDTAQALAVEGLSRLVIDLGEVTFIDAAGIGALLQARNRAHDRGVGVVLRAASQPVIRLLTLAGLTGAFDTT